MLQALVGWAGSCGSRGESFRIRMRRGIKKRSVHTYSNPTSKSNPIPIHLHANVMEPTTTTTTTTAPAAAEPGSPKASGNKRQRKAALLPLGDVTNLLPNTPTNPSTRRPLPLPSDTTACSSASASVTPVSKGSFAAVAEEHSSAKSAISTAYTRRKTTERRRNSTTNNEVPSPAGTATCPSLGKGTRTSRKTSLAQDTQPISSSVPCHQAKKMRHTRKDNLSSGKPKLPEDFVKKQRAYFDEIDAFELPEEAASETDLE